VFRTEEADYYAHIAETNLRRVQMQISRQKNARIEIDARTVKR
jgi:hypothetical protein